MLNDQERGLPRRMRRAIISRRSTLIKKKVPFGRVRVIDFETGPDMQDNRTVYKHFTRGVVDRCTTDELLMALVA
jgi:hypothetical protein